jgi:hypothetical protein
LGTLYTYLIQIFRENIIYLLWGRKAQLLKDTSIFEEEDNFILDVDILESK